ncbi:MAG TPA: MBL fold metallo-hydrolase [Candidatus Sulfotelmatobacter sp.]|nr:MBL fold metallo-hydrolase [Candidatus Sulfotelmatobacter sp.]
MSELSRGEFFGVTAATGVAGAVNPGGAVVAAPGGNATLTTRWYGGGVFELATPDDKTIVLVDCWIWNNSGWKAFNLEKPPEFASAAAYAAHIKSRKPDVVIVTLSHDHGDHIGDYFETLAALVAAGVDVKTVGQSDLMRVGLVPKFKAAGLDNTALVLNNGAGMNFGGHAAYKGVQTFLVPAVHSCASGFPAAGFIIDVGGARVYASGDTDMYGDMATVGGRYHPDLAVVCAGNGAFTMGPADAAYTCKLMGVTQAIPVHYAHNPLVLGPQAADLFRGALASAAPQAKATTFAHPGERLTLTIARNPNRA